MPTSPGKLVVISGPSGAGKTTVVRELVARHPDRLALSVSATTRPPRTGEVNGRDYHFLSNEEFQRRRAAGEFLECCEVFGRGAWYGTLAAEVESGLKAGRSVILEIDVNGMQAVRARRPDVLTIFVLPDSLAELERRLRNRKTEEEEAIRRRLEVAERELAAAAEYQHQVVNDTVEQAVQDLTRILVPE